MQHFEPYQIWLLMGGGRLYFLSGWPCGALESGKPMIASTRNENIELERQHNGV